MMRLAFHLRYCLLLFIWVLAGSSPCLADGKIYASTAYKAVPAIPHQRAVIVHRAGEEKLIIQSSFTGPGQDFGWIVPVPATPTLFEAVSPGFLKTIERVVHPEITSDMLDVLAPMGVLTVFVLLWSHNEHRHKRKPTVAIALLLGIVALGMGLFWPSLGTVRQTAGHISTGGVTVTASQTIGEYQVVALQAEFPETLNAWLSANGFMQLPQADHTIVEQYIHDGWQFVTAKLHRAVQGASTPHPLAISFPTSSPIYPMRLTGTLGQDMVLELFVVANQRVDHPLLTVEVCDQFQYKRNLGRVNDFSLPGFLGGTFEQKLGHPDASLYLWDGCVVTRLCARLTPKQMAQDFVLKSQSFEPMRKHYFSHIAGVQRGAITSLGFVIAVALISTLPFAKAICGRHTKKQLGAYTLLAVGLALCVMWLVYLSLPKIKTEVAQRSWHPSVLKLHLASDFREAIVEIGLAHESIKDCDLSQVESIVANYFKEHSKINTYQSMPICQEKSPGNYSIKQQGDNFFIVWYDGNGLPRMINMPLFSKI